jgi:hypothetical protein
MSFGLRAARIRYLIPLVLRELYCEIIELSCLSKAIIVCAVAALI